MKLQKKKLCDNCYGYRDVLKKKITRKSGRTAPADGAPSTIPLSLMSQLCDNCYGYRDVMKKQRGC